VKAGGFFYALSTFARLSTFLVIINKEGKAQRVDKMIYLSTSTSRLYRVTE